MHAPIYSTLFTPPSVQPATLHGATLSTLLFAAPVRYPYLPFPTLLTRIYHQNPQYTLPYSTLHRSTVPFFIPFYFDTRGGICPLIHFTLYPLRFNPIHSTPVRKPTGPACLRIYVGYIHVLQRGADCKSVIPRFSSLVFHRRDHRRTHKHHRRKRSKRNR